MTTLEATAQFGAGPWQQIGWGALNFENDRVRPVLDNQHLAPICSLAPTTTAAEQRTDLGPIPSGLHIYRIEVAGTQIRYYIDGTLRAEHTVASAYPAMHVYLSYNSGSAPALVVDRVWVYPTYVASGNATSCTIDGGAGVNWTTASWDATVPAGTSVQLRTRTSANGSTWSAWSAPLTGGRPDHQQPRPALSAVSGRG